jgi:hypothetical protein
MGAFGFNFPIFSSNLTGHHDTKTAKPIWSCRSKNIETFLSNLGYLWLTRASWIDSLPSEPSASCQSGHIGTNVAPSPRTTINRRKRASFQFSVTLGGHSFTSVRFQDETRVLRTRFDLCYHCGPFPAFVCEVFNNLSVQTLFLRT